jgi:CDP-diacylglycerol--serine O-phosphatidyltransferase
MRAVITAIVFFVIGFFMISRWKFPSVKTLHNQHGSFEMILLIAFLSAVILIGALLHFPLVFFALSWTYFVVAIVLSIVRLITGKKLQMLEDFDPEDD